ncbi:MAG: right-handed parallel beta-helix repeat-containing protein [Polyangiaceae bacterium]|nr:right-handed parallel beta-helix repeat-containing protein [Polyangiaceae bacterium]
MSPRRTDTLLLLTCAMIGVACGSEPGGVASNRDLDSDGAVGLPHDGQTPSHDAPTLGDAGVSVDAAAEPDAVATAPDAGPGPDAGQPDPNYTVDGCFRWFGASKSGALQAALDQHACVEVQAGTFVLSGPVYAKPGKTLRGVSAAASVLVASASWNFGCCDAMISDTLPGNPAQSPFTVQRLTLDGAGVATYNVCCRGYTVEDTILKRSRCSAIGAVGAGVVARKNQMLDSAKPTSVPGKGQVTCATGNFGGVLEGAAIYSEGKASNYGTLIEDNVITGSFGPALDINGAWGGTFRKNVVSGNTSWAAVSLYGASQWLIEDNHISHPAHQPPQPYHPYCATGPAGGNSAGIFLCQDTDKDSLVTNDNVIRNNKSSFYGILSVGADEIQPYLAPRNNTFQNNDVFGSHVGCADDFKVGQWFSDKNTWTGNNCAGSPNTGPITF